MKARFAMTLCAGAMTLNAPAGLANSPVRQTIRVACPDATDDVPRAQMQSLCLQMIQSLSQRAPRTNIRRVPMTAPAPQSARDMLVRLDLKDGTIALSWQAGPHSARHTGPSRPLDPALLQAGPTAHRAAMDDLVATTDTLIAALPQ